MVMAYIDDNVIATETVEDHMARLREVFECLREAGFKMRVAKCDFMKPEIKYLGRVVSASEARPESCCQVARLGDPSQQNGNAEFFWDSPTTIANSFLALTRQAGRAPTCRHWTKRHIHMGSRTTKSVQRNQESADRGDCACAA